MNSIDKIISKIKKLLALAKSPNPNEAASALRMAQELMAEYNVGQADVNTLDIGEVTTPTAACRKSVPRYENLLVVEISEAFGCRIIRRWSDVWEDEKRVWAFIGLQHRAQIAAYICQVLLRKLKSARTEYIKSLYRVRSKNTKTQRANDFCLAWVNAVTEKLASFAGISGEEKKAIELYVNKNHPDLTDLNINKSSFGKAVDYLNGSQAGSNIQLQHGVGGHFQSPMFLEG